jgi:hypothetical protein
MHTDDSKKFDRRTIEKNLKEGIISAEEWENFLRALPDVSDSVDLVTIEEGQKEKTTKQRRKKSKKSVEKETTPDKEQ